MVADVTDATQNKPGDAFTAGKLYKQRLIKSTEDLGQLNAMWRGKDGENVTFYNHWSMLFISFISFALVKPEIMLNPGRDKSGGMGFDGLTCWNPPH